MTILGIETATAVCSVAVVQDSHLRAELNLNVGKVHAEKLAAAVDWLLTEIGSSPQDVDAVAVSQGPGSFTGLRIGLAFAKGFVLPGEAQLVLVPTLMALAHRLGTTERAICAVLRARRGELYHAVYRWEGESLVQFEPPRVLADDELPNHVPAGAVLTGETERLDTNLLEHVIGERGISVAPAWLRTASAGSVALLGHQFARRGEFADPASAEPFYLQDFVARKPKAVIDDAS